MRKTIINTTVLVAGLFGFFVSMQPLAVGAEKACDATTDRLFWDSIKDETDPAYFKA